MDRAFWTASPCIGRLARTPRNRGSDCAPSTPRPRASGGMVKSGASLRRGLRTNRRPLSLGYDGAAGSSHFGFRAACCGRPSPFLVEFQSFSKQNLGKLLRILRVSAPNNFPRPIVWAAQILPHQAHPCPSRLAKFYASSIC
jgi:hypothetical protein